MSRNTFLLRVWLLSLQNWWMLLPCSLVSMATPVFYEHGCLSNTVAMATVTRYFLKQITANLIDKICYYASHMNESSLNDSKKFWFLTCFKCTLLNLVQNVVRSLLSAGDPNIIIGVLSYNDHFRWISSYTLLFFFFFFRVYPQLKHRLAECAISC